MHTIETLSIGYRSEEWRVERGSEWVGNAWQRGLAHSVVAVFLIWGGHT